jgi:basic membrane lipoprotein Med (substrate-binding protein (PBP1-ABC) superfamily)
MKGKLFYSLFAVVVCAALLPSAYGAEPCLIIGALYGGPITDAGYNQAMHESIMQIKENIACVEIIEAENVPEEAGQRLQWKT